MNLLLTAFICTIIASFSLALAPEPFNYVVAAGSVALFLAISAILGVRKTFPCDEDIYGECLDDVPRYVEDESHKLKPVAKIDIHC